ncbi:L-aspartate oxidase [bacterium BMS3Bbin04]|nr:L-aspartate oxidase [bacterium BMS3Bbin04]
MIAETADVLVIGSGIAGLTFALEAAQFGRVVVVTKKDRAESATNYAQGGIAAVMGEGDSLDSHIHDTVEAGAGLCKEEIVKIVVSEGPGKIRRLMEWGAEFSEEDGSLALGREGGHSMHRIVHHADATGHEVERALLDALKRHPQVELWENATAVDLITDRHVDIDARPRNKRCYGAYVYDLEMGRIRAVPARVTLLASGGMGMVWKNTTNPTIATGDGVAMSWRAGARIANLEFMQFHPTALYEPDRKGRAFLITEALRGAGGILLNDSGERFMEDVHPRKELASRDIVARAIDMQRKTHGIEHVWLDCSHLNPDKLRKEFPTIYTTLRDEHGINMVREPIPVVPAAHYQCGGVLCDENAHSTIDNLLVAGEVACTGLHGANRLASNSLLEAVVFASRAAEETKRILEATPKEPLPQIPVWNDSGTYDDEEFVLIRHDVSEIRNLMEDYVGIIRSDLRLERAGRRLAIITVEVEDYWRRTTVSNEIIELRNLAQVARMIVKCARQRRESRGLHTTTDYPDLDPVLGVRDTVI